MTTNFTAFLITLVIAVASLYFAHLWQSRGKSRCSGSAALAVRDIAEFCQQSVKGTPSKQVVRRLTRQLHEIPYDEWPKQEKDLRRSLQSYFYYSFPWHELDHRLSHVSAADRMDVYTSGFLSFAPNGYVREKATRHLAENRNGKELPFLLLRGVDWVKPVRDVAVDALTNRLLEKYFPHFLECLDLLKPLEKSEHREVKELAANIKSLVLSQATSDQLANKFWKSNTKTRRYCADLILANPGAMQENLFNVLAGSSDSIIRQTVVPLIKTRFSHEQAVTRLKGMTHDPSYVIRSLALQELAKVDEEAAEPLLIEGLLDTSGRVRSICRYLVLERVPLNLRQYYVEHTQSSASRIQKAAIQSLGEVGSADDVPLLLDLFDDPKPGVRASAISAVGRLDGKAAINHFLKALHDDMPNVRRQAANALRNHIDAVTPEMVLRAYAEGGAHTRQYAIGLARKLPKWESLQVMLQMMGDASATEQDLLEDGVTEWMRTFNLNLRQPTTEQLRKARAGLVEMEAKVDRSIAERLEFYLR